MSSTNRLNVQDISERSAALKSREVAAAERDAKLALAEEQVRGRQREQDARQLTLDEAESEVNTSLQCQYLLP